MKPWQCCDKDNWNETPFCPLCGKQWPNDLVTLLQHINVQVNQQKKQKEKYERHLKDVGTNEPYCNRRITKFTRTTEKWIRWRDALKELMDAS